jgi:glucosamine-6-phosphate deaminase
MKQMQMQSSRFGAVGNAIERLPVAVFNSRDEASVQVAGRIAELIRERQASGDNVVLGLATGSTPVMVYRELIRMHREEGLGFGNVITFNLDEYYPIKQNHRESYNRFMREQLFDHIDIPEENIHIPNGEIDREEAFEHCRQYEKQIKAFGGLDIQLLGIGRTGHIGFNEPGSGKDSRTRLITLNALTRQDAARDFLGEANVPRYAITMGVGTILEAKEIILMAWGEGKAGVVAKAVEEAPTEQIPASYLQAHGNVTIILDAAASSGLMRARQPWRLRFIEWDDDLEYQAVTNLSLTTGKAVLKLVENDYSEHGLADLLTHRGPAYDLNIKVFNRIQHTITGWPGGKPGADDTFRPERAEPAQKRVLVFAAEPGEEVSGMGGTLHRLIRHGHDVHVAILTSGDLSVPDNEAESFMGLLESLELNQEVPLQVSIGGIGDILHELENKQFEDQDSPSLRRLKGLIREGEAKLSVTGLGMSPQQIHFLRLPFYAKGRYRQFVPEECDSAMVARLLGAIRPHQVFMSGSKADPASVAGTGFKVLGDAIRAVQPEDWFAGCRFWLYRGDGEEWKSNEVDMAVPLSPDELQSKSTAIFQHRTQQGGGPISKAVEIDLWEMIEQLNRRTAKAYDKLGMAEYEAMECFRRFSEI